MKQKCTYGKLFILIMVGFLLIPVYSFARSVADSEKDVLKSEKNMLNANIAEYQKRIVEINEKVLKLKMNTEWLLLKILRLEDQGSVVPYTLKKATDNNEDQKEALESENKRLKRFIRNHKNTITQINRKLYGTKRKKSTGSKKTIKKGTGKKASKFKSKYGAKSDLSTLRKKLQGAINTNGLKNWLKLTNDGSQLKLAMILPILFAPGKTIIPNEYKKFFNKFANFIKPFIKSYLIRIEVAGFTDKSKVTKGNKYSSNFEIGAGRASSVVKQLVKEGINPSVFSVVSRGEYGIPAGKYSNKKANALSRRAEVTVYVKNK